MDQITLLQDLSLKPLETVLKEHKRAGFLRNSNDPTTFTTCHIFAVQVDVLNINKIPVQVHRVFVQGVDFPEYVNVGWLLHTEIDYCLICCAEFGFFCHRHSCWACGNVLCFKCCSELMVVEEIASLGPKRVCLQCYYGQVDTHTIVVS